MPRRRAVKMSRMSCSSPPKSSSRMFRHVPLVQGLVGGFVLIVLVVVAIPALSQMAEQDGRTKALAQAKQIGLALKLFSGDNDGV